MNGSNTQTQERRLDVNKQRNWSHSRRLLPTALTVPVVVGIAAIASADVEKTWVAGEALTAADLNASFAALDQRIEALEASPLVLEDASSVAETSEVYGDLVYQSMSLDLSAGTWRIEAFASISSVVNPDAIQIGLWDDTAQAELEGARSPFSSTVAYSAAGPGAPCDWATVFCSASMAYTSKVVTLSAPTTIRVAAFRNGNSAVRLVGAMGVQPSHRLVATRMD